MSSHEKLTGHTPFPVVELNEIEFSLLSPHEIYMLLEGIVIEQGYDSSKVLYTGVDLDDEQPHTRGFGNRRETWAFNATETKQGICGSSAIDHDIRSPLYYALKSTSEPGVVITDATKFRQLGNIEGELYTRTQHEYQLLDTVATFDEAVIGILYIAND